MTLFIGFYAPKPPGLFGTMIEYYWFGGKERKEKEVAKWRKLKNIDRHLKKNVFLPRFRAGTFLCFCCLN